MFLVTNQLHACEKHKFVIVYTVYAFQAKNLYWRCLSQLPDIYMTPLWIVMKRTIKVIDSGVQVKLHIGIIGKQ